MIRGMGKGFAADRVCSELIERGVAGAYVGIGGDMHVSGESPDESGWMIGVDDPFNEGTDVAVIALREGGVATSSRLHRAWNKGTHEIHHIVNPRTGEPVQTKWVAITTVTGDAWWAEAWSKAAFIIGDESAWERLGAANVAAIAVDDKGMHLRSPEFGDIATWLRS